MTIAIPMERMDKDGNLEAIEFYDELGGHIMDALWDPRDPQDKEHRMAFRQWAYKHMRNNDYDVQL